MEPIFSIYALSERRAFWTRTVPYVVLAGVTFLLYAPSLYYGFAWDDAMYIVQNYRIQVFGLDRLAALWKHSYLDNYAPIHQTLLAAMYSVFGLDPPGYHFCQLLLHAACVCLLYFLLAEIESVGIAALASLLFAVFPPNTENVAWISETKSTLALLFLLFSFYFFERFRRQGKTMAAAACILFFAASLLTKIGGIAAPALFLFYDYWKESRFDRKRIAVHVVLFLVAAAMAIVHIQSAASVKGDAAQMLVNGALTKIQLPVNTVTPYFGGFFVHLLNMPLLFFFYVRTIFVPHPLTIWHVVTIYDSPTWQVCLAWIALCCLAFVALRCERRVRFWLLWFAVFLAPVLQLIPNSTWVADRYLYVPAIGAFALLARLFLFAWERASLSPVRCALALGYLAMVGTFGWLTARHLPVWRDNLALSSDAARYCHGSAMCSFMIGKAQLETEHPERAIPELERAAALRPSVTYLKALGDAYTDKTGEYQKAFDVYRRIQNSGSMLQLTYLVSVGKAYYLSGDLANAKRVAEGGLNMSPSHSSLLLMNGFVQWKLGNHAAARESLRRGIQQNSINPLTAHPARFLNFFWEHPDEVGRILHDLGPL